ncbi:MAG: hypothetical protein M5U09_22300 [Gammaproteobacteria bacterium]|nr:hypothetical protein [Gammaproteobacteria bacterium]
MVDEAELLHVAAREVTTPDPLLVYGYARLDADERAFLKAYAADGSELVLPGGAKTMFDENRATADELLTDGGTAGDRADGSAEPGRAGVEKVLESCVSCQSYV